MYIFIKELPLYVSESFSGRFRELENKEKDQLVIPKSGRGRLRELLITEFYVTVSTGFHNSGRN